MPYLQHHIRDRLTGIDVYDLNNSGQRHASLLVRDVLSDELTLNIEKAFSMAVRCW